MQANIKSAFVGNCEEAITVIDEMLTELQRKLLKLENTKKDYESLVDEIDRLWEEKQSILMEDASERTPEGVCRMESVGTACEIQRIR